MAGRPRNFDRESALELALNAFWEQGYDATSISQLTGAMGIKPPSLYAAFGDKHSLFCEASAQYAARVDGSLSESLSEPDVRIAIERVLTETAAFHTEAGHPRGCLVMSEPHLGAERATLLGLLVDRIQVGIDDGQLSADTDAAGLADFIFLVISGMSARARDGATHAQLQDTVQRTMAAWPTAGSATTS